MGRVGSSSDNGDSPNGKMLGALLTAGLVFVGTAIGISRTSTGTLGRKHRTRGETPTESHEPAKESPKDAIPCVNVSKRFATCLESKGYDIKNCLIYFDLLKDCEKS